VRAPDLVEPIVGWRLWLVVADGGYLWLESVLYPARWLPRQSLRASCSTHRRPHLWVPAETAEPGPPHRAPSESCQCGIYAVAGPATLAPFLDSTLLERGAIERVVGRVRLWGKVVECERGWRGERAYPDRIYVPCRENVSRDVRRAHEIVAGLVDYGVPVSLLGSRSTPEIVASAMRAAA
jgi:hypothetical protein